VNLEQQERLFKNQIRLGLREILQQELNFYSNAFNNISACASILAGFAFTGIMLDPYDHKSDNQPKWLQTMEWDPSRAIEAVFNTSAAATTCICLLTLVYSNYLGLFSTRLALRGGEMAVEESVMKIRGEYKVVLYSLTVSVECFIVTLPVLAFYKMELIDSFLVTSVSIPSGVAVVYLYRRARRLFYLDKDDRFAAAKKKSAKKKGNQEAGINFDVQNASSHQRIKDKSEHGGRLSEIVQELDGRNDSFYQPNRNRKSTVMRRSVSWDATQLVDQNMISENEQLQEMNQNKNTSSKRISALGKRFSLFNKTKENVKNPVLSSGNGF